MIQSRCYRILSALMLLAIILSAFPGFLPMSALPRAEAAEAGPIGGNRWPIIAPDFTVPRPAVGKAAVSPGPGTTTGKIESFLPFAPGKRESIAPSPKPVYSPPAMPLFYQPAEEYVFAALVNGGGVARWNGASWELVNTNLNHAKARNVHKIAVDPLNPTTLFIATEDGVYRTMDALGACAWERAFTYTNPFSWTMSVAAHPFTAGRFLAGADTPAPNEVTLYVTSDTGEHWSAVPVGGSGWGDQPMDICIGRAQGQTVYIPGHSGALFRSTDGGATFARISTGSNGINPYACAMGLGDDAEVYVVTPSWTEGNVARSTDSGATWEKQAPRGAVHYMDVAVDASGRVWTVDWKGHRVLWTTGEWGTAWNESADLGVQLRTVAIGAPGTTWVGGEGNYTWKYTGTAWVAHQIPCELTGGCRWIEDIAPLSGYFYALVSPTLSLVDAAPAQVTADGVDTAAITVTVLGEHGLPIPGVAVTLTHTGAATLTQPASTTDAQGRAFGSIRSSQVGVVEVSARAAGVDLGETAQVTFIGVDLTMQQAGPALAAPGTAFTHTLAVSNAGRLPATGVVVTDTLPAEVEFITQSAPFTFSRAGAVLTWQVGVLTVSQQASWTVQVRLSSQTPAGALLTNTVVAASPAAEHDLDNNTATATTLVRGALHVDPAQPDIVVGAGESAVLVVTARNTGENDLHGLYVSLPVSLSWVTAAGLSSSLPAHSTDPFTLTVAPPTSTPPGYYQGRVTVHTNEGEETAVALTVLVWNGPRGAVAFSVTTELSGTALPGAEVTLLYLGGASSNTLILQNLTGATGTLTMAGVPAGDYNYRVTAPGYAARWGQTTVPEGGVASVPVQLWSDFVNYEWWVEEGDIPDEYDVLLTITYRLTDRPILVPCGPWHEFPLEGEAPHSGGIEIHNPSGVDAFSVTVSASDVHGLAMNIAGNGWLGNVAGESGTTIHYTATAGEGLDSNYEAGRLLLSGTYFSGSERLPFTQSIPLLVNPTPTMTCGCTTDPEYYRTHCERPGVPGGPGGPPPPPYHGGWDPIVPGPYQQARLRLSQTATLSRQAFWTTLRMSGRGSHDLDQIQVTLSIVDGTGADASDRFFVDTSQARQAELGATEIHDWIWTLVPKACAAGPEGEDKWYWVSAQVTFRVVDRSPPLNLTFSTGRVLLIVHPAPRMFLYYYLPRDIEADVPFRVQIVAQNWGYGPAADVQLGVPQVRALDGGGGGLELQVVGSDLDLGDVAPFEEALGYVDLRPTASGYVESVAAGLTHRDYQGLRLDPLLLRQQTYLVYCDHVALAAEATLPDPGPECAPPNPPPAPHLVWVRGWADEVAAVPGETVTHTYTVYNLNLAEAVSISLAAASEHGWPTTVAGVINAPPGQGIVVPVRLAVPADAPYNPDDETLQAAYVPDPRITHEDSTTTRVAPIRILRIEVAPGTVLQRNAEGWYTPDPLTYTVVLLSGVAGDLDRLSFHLASERLQAIPVEHQPTLETGPDWVCDSSGCSETLLDWPIVVGENRIAWKIWVQPMITTTLRGYAWLLWENYPEEEADAPDVQVPKAFIHPVIIVPGFLGSFPLSEDFGFLDPFEYTYNPLSDYLQVLGYEPNVSLFGFAYNWMRDIGSTAVLLREQIGEIQNYSERTYVDYTKVDLVTHSMGGLVARADIEGQGYPGNVGTLITLATPHQGVPGSYLTWEGNNTDWIGVPELAPILRGYAIAERYCHLEVRFNCPPPLPREICLIPVCSDGELHNFIQARVLAVRDTLPPVNVPVPYLITVTGNVTVNYPYGRPDNDFLEDLNTNGGLYDAARLLAPELKVWALYSLADPGGTVLRFRVGPPGTPLWLNGTVRDRNDWVRGRTDTANDSGDGLVPGYSAKIDTIPDLMGLWERVQKKPFAHADAPKTPDVMEWVLQVLTGVVPPGPGEWPELCAKWPEVCPQP